MYTPTLGLRPKIQGGRKKGEKRYCVSSAFKVYALRSAKETLSRKKNGGENILH
jgi:hypothetical protein